MVERLRLPAGGRVDVGGYGRKQRKIGSGKVQSYDLNLSAFVVYLCLGYDWCVKSWDGVRWNNRERMLPRNRLQGILKKVCLGLAALASWECCRLYNNNHREVAHCRIGR